MFKDKLRELRKDKGLSQQELADSIYVSRSAICKWEMGNGMPSEANIEALCAFFEVDEEWLLDRNDLKEGIEITKRNRNVNVLNLILIVLSVVFLSITLTILSSINFIINIKVPISLWTLFNTYELLMIIGGFFISFGIGLLLIFNNNGFLTININDIQRKKVLSFGYALLLILFTFFIMYCIIRMNDPNEYKASLSINMLVQDIILSSVVALIPLSYVLSTKKLKIIEITFSVLTFVTFIIALLFFVWSAISVYGDNNIAVAVGLILNGVFALASIILSATSLFFNIKIKRSSKVLMITYISIIGSNILMFIVIATMFL